MIVVVGGQCRNVGKTTVVCAIIRKFESLEWTAIKISRHSHREHSLESPKNDTERYHTAGARGARLLRTPSADETLRFLRPLLAAGVPLIIESNSVLEVLEPDYYVLVVDARQDDVKESAKRFVPKANAVVSCFSTGQPVFSAGRPFMSLQEMLDDLGQHVIHVDRETA